MGFDLIPDGRLSHQRSPFALIPVEGSEELRIIDLRNGEEFPLRDILAHPSFADALASVMVGATSEAAGVAGLVPEPSAGDEAKFLNGAGQWASATGRRIVIYSHQVTAANSGGSTSATTLNPRPLNVYEAFGGLPSWASAISSDRFTLQPGDYLISWWGVGYRIGRNKAILRNETAGTQYWYASTQHSDNTAQTTTTSAAWNRIITVATASEFSLSHYSELARASDGLGLNGNYGTNTFGQVIVERV